MRKSIFGIVILVLLLLFSGSLSASDKISKVEVMGESEIINNNESEAKKLAIEDSLKSAVERVIVRILSTDIIVSNFKAMNDLLYVKTRDYVQGYKVLTEFKVKNKFRVFVSASISDDKLLESLTESGFILEKENLPKILLLVAEQNTDMTEKYWWKGEIPYEKSIAEKTLESEILKRGYTVIPYDYGIIKKIESEGKEGKETGAEDKTATEKSYFELENAMAAKIGQMLNADVVVVGNVLGKKSPNRIGENHSFKGIVNLRAVFTKDGSEFSKIFQTEALVSPDENDGGNQVVEKVSATAGERIASLIMKEWQVAKNKPTVIDVEISGPQYLRNFAYLKSILRKMDGVNDIKTKNFKADGATLTINYKGNGKLFAESLILQNISRFGLNITDIKDDSLRVQLVPLR